MHPFVVGDLGSQERFIHVFDDFTLPATLQELDTASDFIRYLERKEHFIKSGHLTYASGEEDLLALYLQTRNRSDEHDFDFPAQFVPMAIERGLWSNLKVHERYIAKKDADKVSYWWDSLIETFNGQYMSGSLVK